MATRNISLLQTIIAANFMADVDQVAQVAGLVVEGHAADGTYFRILLAHMQSKLGRGRRARRSAFTKQGELDLLNATHDQFYPAVLKGVGPDELDTTERNRRATFARSAASTVRYFIERGGDVRAVDVPTITKAGLRAMVKPETPPPEGETRAERSFRKATDAVVKAAQRLLARGDPDEARERIEQAADALEALLESIPTQQQPQADVGATTTTIVGQRPGARSTPASQPMLHRGA